MGLVRIAIMGLSALPFLANAAAGASIDVGSHVLRPNMSGQSVQIYVSGGKEVPGVNLFVQIGDGGPELAEYGFPPGTNGPEITSVDLTTDSIFSSSSSPQDDQEGLPQVAISSIEFLVPGESAVADGLLGTLTIDTTGFSRGIWDLSLEGVLPMFDRGPFATDFAGVPATIINGTVEIAEDLLGDFDTNDTVDVLDVELLQAAIRGNSTDSFYDVDFNGSVDTDDLRFHVTDILDAFFGDVDLNGRVDATDLNQVGLSWRATGASIGWSDGDFNGDLQVNATDLNFLGLNWRAGAAAASVPEPATEECLGLVVAFCVWGLQRRHTREQSRTTQSSSVR